MPTKNKFFPQSFFAYYFLKVHLYQFSLIKSQKEVAKSGNVKNNDESGFGRPKYMWILRIRIHNTANFQYILNKLKTDQINLTGRNSGPNYRQQDYWVGTSQYIQCLSIDTIQTNFTVIKRRVGQFWEIFTDFFILYC